MNPFSRDTSIARLSLQLSKHIHRVQATIWVALLVVVVPSGILFEFSSWIGHGSALINIDLLLAAAIGCLLAGKHRRAAGILTFLLVSLISSIAVLRSVGVLYLGDPANAAGYLAFLGHWPWRSILPPFFASLLFLSAVAWVASRLDFRNASSTVLVAMAIAVVLLDIAIGSNSIMAKQRIFSVNIATSSTYQLIAIVRQRIMSKPFRIELRLPRSMAADVQERLDVGKRIFSVSVESWGEFTDAQRQRQVTAALSKLLGRDYAIDFSSHEYLGGTLSGELRELCGIRSVGIPSGDETMRHLHENCLPTILARKGYATWAGHANTGAFYGRDTLYPGLGFKIARFGREFIDQAGSSPCAAVVFDGPCDRIVLRAALTALRGQAKGLSHVMTLETHLPLAGRTVADYQCAASNEAMDPAICLYINRMSGALEEVAQEVLAAFPRPDVIYIYGDHSPPYASARLRDNFVVGRVPFVTLRQLNPQGLYKTLPISAPVAGEDRAAVN